MKSSALSAKFRMVLLPFCPFVRQEVLVNVLLSDSQKKILHYVAG